MSVVVALILVVLVAGVVVALRGRLVSPSRPEVVPEEPAQLTVYTPTARPTVLPTATITQSIREEPVGQAATPAKQAQPTSAPSRTATPTLAPTATPSPVPTLTSTATVTPSPVPTSTLTPTTTPSPTVAAAVAPARATSTPIPAQGAPTVTVLPASAGQCEVGRIAGVAWVDINANGQRDGDDPPLAGVAVTLEDVAGQIVRTVITSGSGRYQIDNLPAGKYSLRAATPADHEAITALVWGVDLRCATITLDFGYRPQQ